MSVNSDSSRDRELVLKHQPSFSDSGRASVPMWDSSDPDRAPPPLPLNPGSSSPAAKPNASKNIAAAAEAFAAKARESAYTINPPPQKSPERSLIKGQHHKRLQSLQHAGLTDRNSFTDALGSLDRSPERSPERFPRSPAIEFENRSPERSPTRTGTPTPSSRDQSKDTPTLRPLRPPLKAILGENTPPSATMVALQNMTIPKEYLSAPKEPDSHADITNNSPSIIRNPQTFEAISTQILGLTTIATNLQKEMAQLSRRSKDNATDLVSLKEATNSRDEDIRKSLKDLAHHVTSRMLEPEHGTRTASNYSRSPGGFLLDSKPHNFEPGMPKSYSLPRLGSPGVTASDLSAASYNMEGAASIALLEKIWRDMGTREGQDRLIVTLTEMKDQPKSNETDPLMTKKLEEILLLLKESAGSRALVTRRDNGNGGGIQAPRLGLDFDPKPAPLTHSSRELTTPPKQGQNPKAADFVNEDLQKLLKKMKDSITEGGGMTAEVKANLRELRGEVLGMGRDIARKLDQAEATNQSMTGIPQGPGPEEIAQIVGEGLAELKVHMEDLMREKRRQSSSSIASRRSIDNQEVYAAVKNALTEFPLHQQVALQQPGSGLEREEILEAVREAWETYKPEIELQNFGLERDEILQCLKEGLQQYQPHDQERELGGASYDEVLDAVREGLHDFRPPPIETEASITKEEILMSVRECLETFEFPAPPVVPPREPEITRDDVLDAVREGLSTQAPLSREIEFNRDDLFEAVKAGLEGVPTPKDGVGEKVLDKMEDLIEGMRVEFKQYSVANGGDTEQVLDAMKDGLEVLRADIESYVDRAADVTGKDEIIDTVRHGLDHLRTDLESSIANIPRPNGQTNSGELLDAMEKEFEHLRQTIAVSMVRSGGEGPEREEILDIIREGLENANTRMPRDINTDSGAETISVVKEEFEQLRESLATTLVRADPNPDHGAETIHVVREEFEHLRETLATTLVRGDSNQDNNAETINIMREEFDHLRETLATTLVRGGAAADKEEVLETIRESHDSLRADILAKNDRPESILSGTGEVLDALNDGLESIRADMEKLATRPVDMTVNYEILETLKEGLAGVRADVDRMHAEQGQGRQRGYSTAGEGEVVIAENDGEGIRRNDIGNLEMMITQLRIKVEALDNMPPPPPVTTAAPDSLVKEDLEGLEAMLEDIQAALAEIVQKEQSPNENAATKDDTEALETLLRNTKARIDEFGSSDPEGFAKVSHFESLETMINDAHDTLRDLGSDSASKKDVGSLETLLMEVRDSLDDLREKGLGADDVDKVTKTDIEALATICIDAKTQVAELILPDVETLPTKAEIGELTDLIRSFHDEVVEEHNLTAQAFDARKTEHGGLADKMEDVKLIFEGVREELKSKIKEGNHSIKDLSKTLETFAENVTAKDTSATVNELMEISKREFESLHAASEGVKEHNESNHAVLLDKYTEYKDGMVGELTAKLDARFDEIMIKYDDAQQAAQEKERAMDDKAAQREDALNATKTAAEDLRLLIDTLGSTVTDSCDRMSEDSKTVFTRVEEVGLKLDNLLEKDDQAEHQMTRAEISKTLASVEGIQAHSNEYHPKIFDAVKDVLTIVGQHYEQSRTSTEEIKTSVQAIPAAIPLPAIAPPLPPPEIIREVPAQEKYDDSEVQSKLDQLVTHATEAGKSVAEIDLLEEIREQVTATSNQLNDFVTAQHEIITETNNVHAKEAEEAAIALEKRTAQKSMVEADIVRLTEEKDELGQDVRDLRKEKDELITLRSKMQADLSSLETALQIRREELHIMEARADGLERRILDGVLDHSRSLLTTSRPQSSLKEMNLKRVSSAASNTTATTRQSTIGHAVPSSNQSAISSGIGMALKRRQAPRSSANSTTGKPDRRILSLSTLGASKVNSADRSLILANPSITGGTTRASGVGAGGLKRSHSVKSNFPPRKTSWGGTKAIGTYGDDGIDDGEDKENSVLDEEDEEDMQEGSEAGTERRTSYTGTYSGTGSYGEGSVVSSEDKRNSYTTSTVGTVGTRDFAVTEDGDSDYEHEPEDDEAEPGNEGLYVPKEAYQGHEAAAKGEMPNSGEMVVYGQPSDSGIGTEPPTAHLEGGIDYFRKE